MPEITLDGKTYRSPTEQAHRVGTHPSAIYRWLKFKDLAALRKPGGWLIADSDLNEFMQRLAAERQRKSTPPPRTVGQRQRAAEAAGRALKRAGC